MTDPKDPSTFDLCGWIEQQKAAQEAQRAVDLRVYRVLCKSLADAYGLNTHAQREELREALQVTATLSAKLRVY